MENASSNKMEIRIIVNTFWPRDSLVFPNRCRTSSFLRSQISGRKELINSPRAATEVASREVASSGKLRDGIKRSIQNSQLFENEVFKIRIAVPATCPMSLEDCVREFPGYARLLHNHAHYRRNSRSRYCSCFAWLCHQGGASPTGALRHWRLSNF